MAKAFYKVSCFILLQIFEIQLFVPIHVSHQ